MEFALHSCAMFGVVCVTPLSDVWCSMRDTPGRCSGSLRYTPE